MAKSSRKQPGKNTREEVYTVNFTSRKREVPRSRSGALIECGYKPDSGKVPPEYLARITSLRNRTTVIGVLQSDVTTRVESRWEPLVPQSMLAKGNALLQIATSGRKSLVSKATSRRMWQGSTPMVISMKLKFEAIDSGFADVVEPIRLLESIALPSEPGAIRPGQLSYGGALEKIKGIGSDIRHGNFSEAWGEAQDVISKLPVLSPPGPTPFTIEGLLNLKKQRGESGRIAKEIESLDGGDLIIVEIGRLLTFYNVIVREVTGNHKVKFDSSGDAVSGEVDIVFETYEMMTVESLLDAYRKTDVSVSTEKSPEQGSIRDQGNY